MDMILLANIFGCFCFSVCEHKELGVYVDKLSKHIVTDVSELFGLLEKGKKNRWVIMKSTGRQIIMMEKRALRASIRSDEGITPETSAF